MRAEVLRETVHDGLTRVTEPFRDEMSAALLRADKLAEENDELRQELQRLRESAHSVREGTPDHPLAAQTLAVLDRLEAAIRVEPAAKPERAAEAVVLPPPHVASPADAPPVLPPPPRKGIGAGAFVVACLVCLAVGIMLGALAR